MPYVTYLPTILPNSTNQGWNEVSRLYCVVAIRPPWTTTYVKMILSTTALNVYRTKLDIAKLLLDILYGNLLIIFDLLNEFI